jgi:hypothetical protein
MVEFCIIIDCSVLTVGRALAVSRKVWPPSVCTVLLLIARYLYHRPTMPPKNKTGGNIFIFSQAIDRVLQDYAPLKSSQAQRLPVYVCASQ